MKNILHTSLFLTDIGPVTSTLKFFQGEAYEDNTEELSHLTRGLSGKLRVSTYYLEEFVKNFPGIVSVGVIEKSIKVPRWFFDFHNKLLGKELDCEIVDNLEAVEPPYNKARFGITINDANSAHCHLSIRCYNSGEYNSVVIGSAIAEQFVRDFPGLINLRNENLTIYNPAWIAEIQKSLLNRG